MTCPKCKTQYNVVVDSRYDSKKDIRRRRYECYTCGSRWSTEEKKIFGTLKTKDKRM